MSDINKKIKELKKRIQKDYITEFGIENFRVFKDYTNFKLKPFTILTGTNNSGKSSLTKALLLLKDNNNEINSESCESVILNYFKGNHEHNLGNHQLVPNEKNKEKSTKFYFTFFKDYQYLKEISPKGEILNDYGIAVDGKTVITQRGGHIKFNYLKLIEYLKERLEVIDIQDRTNINSFIFRLEDESKCDFHSVDINLNDFLHLYDNEGNLNKIKSNQFAQKYAEFKVNGVFTDLYDLDCKYLNLKDINEDFLDLNWYISLIYVFHKITDVELTENEIKELIPLSKGIFSDNSVYFYGQYKNMIALNEIIYIPTIKEQIKRTYSIIDNSFIKNLIVKETLKNIDNFDNELQYNLEISSLRKNEIEEKESFFKVNKFIEKWLKEFEIGEKLSYGYNTESDTFFIKIDDKSLPEYGLGYSQLLYLIFALHNEIESYSRKSLNATYHFPRTYIIEEPETSLHPLFQSKIAEMLVEAQKIFNINFIIETHSEYFIRKLQLLTAKNEIKTDDTVIYYFYNPKNIPNDENQIKEITIDKYGGLSDDFGKGFIDEAINLNFDLLRLNRIRHN